MQGDGGTRWLDLNQNDAAATMKAMADREDLIMRHAYVTSGIVILTALVASPACGQLVNGDFEDGLAGWVGDSLGGAIAPCVTTVAHGGTGTGHFALLEEPQPSPKTGLGSASRLVQDFNALPSVRDFTFRFRFLRSGSLTSPAALPDSLAVSLVKPADGTRLVGSSGDEPSFTPAFFYADSNGRTGYDSERVTVATTQDAQGFTRVNLDISELTGGEAARVIFTLSSADNGVQSVAMIDDVGCACPSGPASKIFVHATTMRFQYTVTNPNAAAGQVIGTIHIQPYASSQQDIAEEDPDGLHIDLATLTGTSPGDTMLDAEVIKLEGPNNYRVEGTLTVTDADNEGPLVQAAFTGSSSIVQYNYRCDGQASVLPPNTTILIPTAGNPAGAWVFNGVPEATLDFVGGQFGGRDGWDGSVTLNEGYQHLASHDFTFLLQSMQLPSTLDAYYSASRLYYSVNIMMTLDMQCVP